MDLSGLKWIKNITDTRSDEKWAYHPNTITQYPDIFHANWDQKTFGLNWKNNDQENAQKPQAGDLILLKQNNCITHLVKILNNDLQGLRSDLSPDDYDIYRQVQVIWITSDWNNPPKVEEIFECNMNLQGGNVANLENFKTFQEYWNESQGGLTGFQEHIQQVLNLN